MVLEPLVWKHQQVLSLLRRTFHTKLHNQTKISPFESFDIVKFKAPFLLKTRYSVELTTIKQTKCIYIRHILTLKRSRIQITVKSVYLLLLDFSDKLKVTEKSATATTQCGVKK